MYNRELFILLAISSHFGRSENNAVVHSVTTPNTIITGSGSGAGPIDDEDQRTKVKSGSGDHQFSGQDLATQNPMNSTQGKHMQATLPNLSQVTLLILSTSQSGPSQIYSAMVQTPILPTSSAYPPCNLSRYSLPYSPKCDALQPELYSAKQCINSGQSAGVCFCASRASGRPLPGVANGTAQTFVGVSCVPLTFSVTIGFLDAWRPLLADRGSHEFASLAGQIEREIASIYSDYGGSQTVNILVFRPGSVLADLSITSVGHPMQLVTDAQSFKNLLDTRLHSGRLANRYLNPALYEFRRQTTATNQEGGSDDRRKNKQHSQLPLDANNLRQDMDGKTTSAAEPSAGGFVLSPGILGAIVGGGVGALALVVLLIAFCVYRIRKADEGSYSLDPAKKATNSAAYQKAPSREFYA